MIVEIILAVVCVILALVAWQHVKYKDFRHQLNQLPGPSPIPFLGNIKEISQQGTALLGMLLHHAKLYEKEGIFRLWIGPNKAMIFCFRPELLEPLMTSSRHIKKSQNYDYLNPWLGKGLLTSDGEKWRSRRKMLTPTFHFKILTGFNNVFNEHARVLVKQLNGVADGRVTNIFNYVTLCALDIICETAMGVNMDGQNNATSPYVNDLITLAELTMYRMFTFYLQPDVIFYSLPVGRRYKRCLKGLHDFTNKVIKEKSAEYTNQTTKGEGRRKSLAESLEQEGEGAGGGHTLLGGSKRLALLDLLLYMRYAEQADVTDTDIRNEVDTFMFEGHDTTASAISWTLYLIGWHPDVQERLQEELQEVFGDSDRDVSMEDLKRLVYLECVIKESMRVIPPVPNIGRELTETCKLGNYTLPAGTSVILFIYALHHLEENFPNHEKFDPDRWANQESEDRNAFAYIPFSAGFRNCIGQKFAMNEQKVVIATLLRHFTFTSTQKREDLRLLIDFITRPDDGIFVKINKRS